MEGIDEGSIKSLGEGLKNLKREAEKKEILNRLNSNPKKRTAHVHKLERVKVDWKNTEFLYKCRNNCSSYVYPNDVVGKIVLCWNCKEPFQVTPKDMERGKVKLNCGCKTISSKLNKITKEIEDKIEVNVNPESLDWLEDN